MIQEKKKKGIVFPIERCKLRDRGEKVKVLQNFLIAGGFLMKKYNTGYYGKLTQKAMAEYQRTLMLTVFEKSNDILSYEQRTAILTNNGKNVGPLALRSFSLLQKQRDDSKKENKEEKKKASKEKDA